MRDIALTIFLLGSLPVVLVRPVYGALLWVWVSVMNPHRLTWGFAYDLPFAYMIAIATILGMLLTKDPKQLPVTPVTVTLFLLVAWMGVSLVFAFDFDGSWPLWERLMKIQVMTVVSLFLLRSREHVHAFVWVVAGSVAYYGIKGGIFTLRGGGEDRVFGPAGTFIEENNALALALVMTIPLLQYLRLHSRNRWVRRGLVAAKVLCAFSALGSHSRGALLAIAAMLAALWVKTKGKLITGLVILALIPIALNFMPERWVKRMQSIEDYEEDASAMGRINAWKMAINLANDRILVGGGFDIYNSAVFSRFAPDPTAIHSAHSIYFQMLGEHGYVGLLLFLILWFLVWRDASWIVQRSRGQVDLTWASDLARMIQVSFIGYAVGGAFLNLAYYDVPFFLLVAIVITRRLLESESSQV